MAKVKLTLVESSKQIEAKINKALIVEVEKLMIKVAKKIVNPIRHLVQTAIMDQDEVTELSGGILAAHFGLPDGRSDINAIIKIWTDNIIVEEQRTFIRAGKISTGIKINMIRRDYQDVLASSAASVITKKGQLLPWLEWLLRFGDIPIVKDFEITFDPRRIRNSRSGQAVMVKKQKGKWRVPREFAGTPQNNFVTRALDSINTQVNALLKNQLNKVI